MTLQDNINRIQRFVSNFNHSNMDRLQAYLSPQFYNYVPQNDEPNAAETIFGFLSDFRAASSNLWLSIENVTAENNIYRGQLSLNGRHDGPLWNVPPTGKQFDLTTDIVMRDIDGRFAIALDNLSPPQAIAALRQIEVVPESMDLPPKHPVIHPEILLKVLFTGQVADKPCSHLDQIRVTEPTTDVCQQCVETGDKWPALRLCLVCGFVGCCDTSVNKHMKAHYKATGHGIFRSIRMDEAWGWCYEDNAFLTSRVLGNSA